VRELQALRECDTLHVLPGSRGGAFDSRYGSVRHAAYVAGLEASLSTASTQPSKCRARLEVGSQMGRMRGAER
jgi:hypothetical protein